MHKLKYISLLLVISFLSVAVNAQHTDKSQKNSENINQIKQCLKGKIKYPFYMQLFKLEGRVFVVLKIDNKGKVENMSTETDYFGKVYSIEHFTNKNRIERLRKKTEKQLTPLFTECTHNMIFAIPETEAERFIRIPVSFGSYSDLDDYGISDDFDDYDYNEELDYHYFDYD